MIYFCLAGAILWLNLVMNVNSQIADILPTNYSESDVFFDRVLVSLDTNCITHKLLKPEVYEIVDSIISSLSCVDIWFDDQTKNKATEDMIFFVSNQTNVNANTQSTATTYDESYFFISSKNETETSLVDCLTNNKLNWTEYCIITTQFDTTFGNSSLFSIEEDCTIQNVNGLTFEFPEIFSDVFNEPDGYLENLDLLNIEDLDTNPDALDGINDQFSYKHVPDGEDPLVDTYVVDGGTYCAHQEFDDSLLCESLHDDPTIPVSRHGTGVASVLVGNTVGIARGFPLFWYNAGHSDPFNRITFGEAVVGVETVLEKIIERGNRASVINLSFGSARDITDRNRWDALFQVSFVHVNICVLSRSFFLFFCCYWTVTHIQKKDTAALAQEKQQIYKTHNHKKLLCLLYSCKYRM